MIFTYLYLIVLINIVKGDDKNWASQLVQDAIKDFNDKTSKSGDELYKYYYTSQSRPIYDALDNFEIDDNYDFIIIGSGSGGSVLANRLSEIPEWKILLLEIGPEPTGLTDVPGFGTYFLFTDYNWGYLMEKQPNMSLGLADQRMHWPHGRVLGGTTLINYMIHIRGNHQDYDRWAAAGNPGWSYNDVLPYFKKSEDYQVTYQDENYHSFGGNLGVQDVPFRTEAAGAFTRALQEYGYDYVDYNGERQMGVSYVHATLRRGSRSSAWRSFIETCRKRPNLRIITGAKVTKILINPYTKTAYGVKFVKAKKTYKVNAKKEVLLSAGALSSPQILMLSGIGPRGHLHELGIPLIQDLPVGERLYDHLTYLGLVITVNESIVIQSSQMSDPKAFVEYNLKGTGPLTSIGGVEALAFIRTPESRDPDPTFSDMELIFIGAGLHSDRGTFFRRSFRVSDESYNAIWRPIEGKYAFSIWPMLFHPLSSGFIRLRSKNPWHYPLFYGNYFTDPENSDIKTFIASIREVQKLLYMPAFQRYDAKLVENIVPGCEGYHYDSDSYWECALRHLSVTLHHQISTCRMGPPTDSGAVVDNQLRVYGVNKLRVVDTSIIPMPLTAHTNIPTYMIGEKASDMIKKDWLNQNVSF
ncbi:glucose dehydrogenase [FAD, quinone]-like [Onthophagus taurus]|uniref:glucose dehydrogenase [FAD, quinone]-like n=1 Tax=Onthophagus taurus TaxID=166361 RepID=UPI0039BE76F6